MRLALVGLGCLVAACHRQPQSAGTFCAPDVSIYSNQPKEGPSVAPAEPITLQFQAGTSRSQIDFPASAHAGNERETYWLAGAGDVSATLQMFGGQASVTIVVLLDSVQTTFKCNADDVSSCLITLPQRSVATVSLGLSGAGIGDGAHVVSVLLMGAGGSDFPSLSFRVMKNGTAFAPLAADQARSAPAMGSSSVIRNDKKTELIQGNDLNITTSPLDLTVGAEALYTTCSTYVDDVAIVAFVDAKQLPIGQDGRPFISLKATPGHRAEQTISAAAPFADGAPHLLSFYLLHGADQYGEAPFGSHTPWAYPPDLIGVAKWAPN